MSVTSISRLISLFLTWNTSGTRAPHLLIGVALDQDRCPGPGLRQGRGLPFLDLGHGLDLEVVAGHKHIHNFRVSPTNKFCWLNYEIELLIFLWRQGWGCEYWKYSLCNWSLLQSYRKRPWRSLFEGRKGLSMWSPFPFFLKAWSSHRKFCSSIVKQLEEALIASSLMFWNPHQQLLATV